MVTEPNSPSSAADSSATGPATAASAAEPAPAAPRLRLGGATKYSEAASAPASAAAAVDALPASQATPDADATVVDSAAFDDAMSAEQARLDAERAARRQARVAALSQSPTEPVTQAAPAQATTKRPVKAVTDRFWGSLALFVLRAVSAAILFIHGLNGLLNQAPALEMWSNTVLPFPRYIALGVSVAEVVVAILLLFGLLTRLAGLVQVGLMALILTFVMWGRWSIFEPGGTGFIGEEELLLGAVGLAFLLLGAGGWSLDRAFRKGREREGLGH